MAIKLFLALDYVRLVPNSVRKTKEKDNTNGKTEKTSLAMNSLVFLKKFPEVGF